MTLGSIVQRLRSPNVLLLTLVALAIVSYGIYRAAGSLFVKDPLLADELMETAEGREELSEQMALRKDVWEQLLLEIAAQKDARYATTMDEAGIVFDVTAAVNDEGAVLSIRGQGQGNAAIDIIDADRDQHPDAIRVFPINENGSPLDPQIAPMGKFADNDRSQFLLGWTLAWGRIAEEFQDIAALQHGAKGKLTIEAEPVQ